MGTGGNTVLDAKAPMVTDRNFKPASVLICILRIWGMRLHIFPRRLGAQLLSTAAVMEMMQVLRSSNGQEIGGIIVPGGATTKNWRKSKLLSNDVVPGLAHRNPGLESRRIRETPSGVMWQHRYEIVIAQTIEEKFICQRGCAGDRNRIFGNFS